jgi:hypothetical protein
LPSSKRCCNPLPKIEFKFAAGIYSSGGGTKAGFKL